MFVALGISFLLTVGTMMIATVLIGACLIVGYVADNWEEYEGLAKAVAVFLGIWVVWFTLVCVFSKPVPPPVKAEVENVRAS